MFSKETYANRRKVLTDKMSGGILLFLGNKENPINFPDNPYPFRQDSSFLYYFGIQEPELAAVIDVDNNQTILFGDELSIDEIVWMGSRETIKEKAGKSGIEKVKPLKELFDFVEKAQNKKREVHFLPPYQPSNKILLSNLLNQKIENLKPSVSFIKSIAVQRSIKEDQEIAEIEKAVTISNEMHLLAMRLAKPGMKEFELVSAIEKYAADREARFAYPPIITKDGQILHNHYRGNALQEGDMVLNDSGVETSLGYAGDLTRTFPVNTQFTARQRELYEVVHAAFKESQAIMKPGLNFKEVHRKASESLVAGLVDVGLMKGNPSEAVEKNAHTLFFQCGVGHFMGLDVHDMEDLGEAYVGYTENEPKDMETFGWKSLRLGKKLEAGNVVTVEPGLYFIPQLIDIWKKENRLSEFINYEKVTAYRDFGGIRIEDDFLITPSGYKLLGGGLISSRKEIEDYRKSNN